jgi:hypothetical protein
MKRFIVLTLLVGVLALASYFFRRPGSSFSSLAPFPVPAPASVAIAKPLPSPTTKKVTPLAQPAKITTKPADKPKRSVAVFDEFGAWARQFTNGSSSLVEGERLALKRREAMLNLIQTDPGKALAQAAPFAWRQQLPPRVTALLEEQLDGRGDFNVAVGTDFAHGTTSVFRNVQMGGKTYQAFVYGWRLAEPCKTGIPLHGIAISGQMAVQADPLRQIGPDEAAALSLQRRQPLEEICSVSGQPAASRGHPVYAEGGGGILCFCGDNHYALVNRHLALAENGGTAGTGDVNTNGIFAATDDNWTHGSKSVLYMRVNFPDDLTEPISEGDAYDSMDQVNSFYTAQSYNLASLDTTVTPVVTVPQIKAYYTPDPGLLLADARVAALQDGYDTANFDRDIVAFTVVPGYTFGGLAYVGGKGVWLQSMDAGVTAHELGHNYGLMHANFWNTTSNFSSVGPGTNLEYGNIYDTMGSAGAGIYQFDAPHKNALDWLKADAVQVVTTNGVYRIYPMDDPARVEGRFYAAIVRKDFMRNYWIEFRNLFTGNPWTQNGALLDWAPWPHSNGGTHLIDTTPGSPDTSDASSRDDAAVVVGRTFNDEAAGVHITTLARGLTGTDPFLDVQVNLGQFPGNQPPFMDVEVDQTNVAPGAEVHFHATATDLDGDALAYSWTFDDFSFSTNNLPWIAKTWTTTGDHVVHCVVSDMKGGEASANSVVTVGSSGGVRISGRVTDTNGQPLEGVLVGNGSAFISGFQGCYTDSDGYYIIANVNGSLTLNAIQYGYTFTATTNWQDPLPGTEAITNVDFAGVALPTVSITSDTNEVLENDSSPHYFTLSRTGETTNDLTVQLYCSGSATLGTEYSLDPSLPTNYVTIPAGSNSITFTFQAIDDTAVTGPATATLTVVDDTNYVTPAYVLAPLAEATITILDNNLPSESTVNVATITPEISEDGMDNGEFVFTRSSGSTQNDLYVNYSIGGTGNPGTDYTPLAGVVLIPAGQSSATIPLQPLDAHTVASNATVALTIAASGTYSVGNSASATITIINDAATVVTVVPTAEPASTSWPGVFTVTREGDLADALVVNYNVGGTAIPGTEYVPLSGSVTIPAHATTANVSLAAIDTGVLEPDELVTLTLTNDYNYVVGTPGSATIAITQNEKPTVTISAPVATVSAQGDTFGEFVLSRNNSSGNLTVYLSVSGTAQSGFDYLALNNPVIIPDGSSSVALDVIPFLNSIWEATNTVILNLLTNESYNVGAPETATVYILPASTSQLPGVGFCFATSSYPETESPGIAVSLSLPSLNPVSVNYIVVGGTAPGSRYSLPAGTLTIQPTNQVGLIPLQIVNNNVPEPAQTIEVALYNPINASLGGIKVHTYTILANDGATVSITATAPNASRAGPVPGNFRITRTGPTNASQVVTFEITGTASAPTDYQPLGTSVTIPAGAAYVDLPVTPTDLYSVEIGQSVVLTLISATAGAIVPPSAATVNISDNNSNPLPVVTVTSTNQPDAVEGGSNGGFLFTRTGSTSSALTISYAVGGTANPGTRYVALSNSVTIPAGQTSVTAPVVAMNDTVAEGEQTVIVSLIVGQTYQIGSATTATVTIQDNDQNVWIDASDFEASKYGPDPGQFTFTRFGTTNTPVTIYYTISGTASNGFDYVLIANSMVIPAGQLTLTLPIIPRITGVVEGPVTVTLTLLPNSAYALGAPTSATVTIEDNYPMLTISAIVTNVLEGSGTNGIFRLTRAGDPYIPFTAYIAPGGTATFGVDYPPFPTNIYFNCGVTYIDLYVTPTNEVVVEGDESVTATIVPNPAYTILSPSNAVLTINDAGAYETPLVTIDSPVGGVAYLVGTNIGLVLSATVTDTNLMDTVTWTEVSGPTNFAFGDITNADTTVLFTNAGIYVLRCTADNGYLQGSADVTAIVAADVLTSTNLLHWTFDEDAGTNVDDTSGAGNNGVFAGTPTWTTNGIYGGALNFAGGNDFVRQATNKSFLNGLREFTLSLWIKTGTTNVDGGFFAGADTTSTNQTLSMVARRLASCGANSNVIEVTVPTTRGVVHRISASDAIRPLEWENITLTWSNTATPSLYINGQPDQPRAGMVAESGLLTNCPEFIVGQGWTDSPGSWNGSVDDVRLFRRALNANEVLALYGWAVSNHAPVVDAGSNVIVQFDVPVTLIGTVTDDGLPNPPDFVTTTWSDYGTNTVPMPDPTSLSNTMVFTNGGLYTFQLTADDGQAAAFRLVTVTAIPPTQVSIYADMPDAYELGPIAGDFTLYRDGDTNDALTVYLAISGTASNGVDYVTLTNLVTFDPGSNSVSIPVMPFLDIAIEGDESVILTVVSNISYSIQNGQAIVTIHDSPYGVWSIQNFTLEQLTKPALTGPRASFENDGMPNFAAYAFNLDPKALNSNPPYRWDLEVSPEDELLHLTLTYTRRLPPRDVEYGVFVSTNLQTWNTGTNYVEEFSSSPDTNGITETVKTRALMPVPSSTNLYMNIGVWLQQVPTD